MYIASEIPEPMNDGYPPKYWMLGRAADKVVEDPIAPYKISQINDASGNGLTIAEPVIAKQPTWNAYLNGRRTPIFSGVAEGLIGPYQAFPTGTEYTIMFVAEHGFGGSTEGFCGQRSGTTLWEISSFANNLTVYDGVKFLFVGTIPIDTPFLATIVLKLGSATSFVRVNRIVTASGLDYTPSGPGGLFSVGIITTSFPLKGRFPELLIWEEILPDHIIDRKEQYLQNYHATS